MKQPPAVLIKNKTQSDLDDKALKNLIVITFAGKTAMDRHLTGTEDAKLLSGRYEVEVCGEEVHECTGIHHEHKHTKAIYPNLLPVRRKYYVIKNVHNSTVKVKHT